MNSVYVLMKQSHSTGLLSFSVMGVFSTMEKAEEYREKKIAWYRKFGVEGNQLFFIEQHLFDETEV